MRKISLIFVLLTLLSVFASAQRIGTLRGRIFNANDNTTLPGANVWVEVNGHMIGASSDADGFFTIKPLNPGMYTLHITYMGFEDVTITQVSVVADKLNLMRDIYLKEKGIIIDGKIATIVANERRLIDVEDPSRMSFIKEDIEMVPDSRDVMSLIDAVSSEIYVSEDRKRVHFRGSRDGTVAFIVDGIRMRNNEANIPGGAIGSMTVYTGGVPAKYGDFTGGVVIIETMTYSDYLSLR